VLENIKYLKIKNYSAKIKIKHKKRVKFIKLKKSSKWLENEMVTLSLEIYVYYIPKITILISPYILVWKLCRERKKKQLDPEE